MKDNNRTEYRRRNGLVMFPIEASEDDRTRFMGVKSINGFRSNREVLSFLLDIEEKDRKAEIRAHEARLNILKGVASGNDNNNPVSTSKGIEREITNAENK